ncbi:hypothetical protein [Enterococcus casseliflavus]|uniref:hypothetical protein n=1 Tax=Enterococcus casseliflavus TaxID=37734 RepID=UPI00224D8BEA|nr:hypothetical protein [Enterococcus casseliflavus]MCX4166912.1 hypothetical protein [Enterococcus casseliflavus]MDV7701295.1 hypothetical protein [Enterococcus casseliflavus]MDV7752534.1 hypothetical protein [Enterococcus casseliflavus]
MELQLTRRTGFYGMGSPLEVMQGKKRIAAINHQQTIFLGLAEQTPIRVRMFFLESQPFHLPKDQSALKLEVVMNPALKRIYIGFYLSLFLMMGVLGLLSISLYSLLFAGVYLVAYFVFVLIYLKKAYLIKEVPHG